MYSRMVEATVKIDGELMPGEKECCWSNTLCLIFIAWF